MTDHSNRRRLAIPLFLAMLVAVLLLAACAAGPTPYSSAGPYPTPSAVLTPDRHTNLLPTPSAAPVPDVNTSLFYTQKTQEALNAQVWQLQLQISNTVQAATATKQAADNDSTATWQAISMAQTVGTMTADAANATATLNRQVASETEAKAGQQTSTAIAEAQMTRTEEANLTATAEAKATRAQQAALDNQTAMVRTWGPIIFLGILAVTAISFLWREMRLRDARGRVIPQEGGIGPLVLVEQRESIEKYLPGFLRWLAWLLETKFMVLDQNNNIHPITIFKGGTVECPPQTDPDRQERVTARGQLIRMAQSLGGGDSEPEGPNTDMPPAFPAALESQSDETEIIVLPVSHPQVSPVIEDAETQLLEGGTA